MVGTNGLPPRNPLVKKCTAWPDKALLKGLEHAERAADIASSGSNTVVVPFLCADCGYYHLTQDAAGAEVVHTDAHGNIVVAGQVTNRDNVGWRVFDLTERNLDTTLRRLIASAANSRLEMRVQVRRKYR